MKRLIGAVLLACAMATFAAASTDIAAPEIDSASSVAALGLLSGGLLVLRARKKK